MKHASTSQHRLFLSQLADLYVIKSQNKKNENVTCSMSVKNFAKGFYTFDFTFALKNIMESSHQFL